MTFKLRFPLFEEVAEAGGGGGATTTAATTTEAATILGAASTAATTATTTAAATTALNPGEWLVDGKFSPDFSSKLPDDMKEHAATLAKFQGVPLVDVLKSYGALQQKLGQRVQPPGEGAKPEEVAAWRKVTGAPDTAEGYKIEKPADLPAEQWNPELAKGFAEMAHKHHLSPAAAKDMVDWWNGQQAAAVQQTQGFMQEYHETVKADLTKAWGEKFVENVEGGQWIAGELNKMATADKSMEAIDLNDPAIGDNPVIIKLLHGFSRWAKAMTSNDTQITGGITTMGNNSKEDRMRAIRESPEYKGDRGAAAQQEAASRLRAIGVTK